MKVLLHHIYEYKKGIRPLALHTMEADFRGQAEEKLRQQEIDFFVSEVNPKKINIFLGEKDCIDIIREIGDKRLSDYTPEEDFILGTMLGYDRLQQCTRYLQQKRHERSFLLKTLFKSSRVAV